MLPSPGSWHCPVRQAGSQDFTIPILERDEAQGFSPISGRLHGLVLWQSGLYYYYLIMCIANSHNSTMSSTMAHTGCQVPGSSLLYKPQGNLCSPLPPLQGAHPGYSHRRTYWGRRKPSWGGAGLMGEEGKRWPSSPLLLSPPRRSEGLVEPWHCPSSPLAPQGWGACCSQTAAQKCGEKIN